MITPLGGSTRETFERASQGSSGIDYLRRFDTSGLPVRIGGEVADEWIRRPPGSVAAVMSTATAAEIALAVNVVLIASVQAAVMLAIALGVLMSAISGNATLTGGLLATLMRKSALAKSAR